MAEKTATTIGVCPRSEYDTIVKRLGGLVGSKPPNQTQFIDNHSEIPPNWNLNEQAFSDCGQIISSHSPGVCACVFVVCVCQCLYSLERATQESECVSVCKTRRK